MSKPYVIESNTFVSLLEFLAIHGHLRDDQIKVITQESTKSNLPIRDVITNAGFLEDSEIVDLLVTSSGFHYCSISKLEASPYLAMSQDLFIETGLIVYGYEETKNQVHVACLNPFDIEAIDKVRAQFDQSPKLMIEVISKADFHRCLDGFTQPDQAGGFREEHVVSWNQKTTSDALQQTSIDAEAFVKGILDQAIASRASDVHFNNSMVHVDIKLRMSGELRSIQSLHRDQWTQVLAYLKVQSGMNMSEQQLPQVGRMTYDYAGRTVDLRCSSHKVGTGENFVIRILDQLSSLIGLPDLGFKPEQVKTLEAELEKTSGMIVVTGPTGSGKTTTLYAMIQSLRSHNLNIMTLEDPIEYDLKGIQQSQINPKIGLGFAEGVRSILRQDPDVILIGEIRDEETARMALRASMTGHLVFTTLHANSALAVPQRFEDLGIPSALLSGNLNCLVSQRLLKGAGNEHYDCREQKRHAVAEIIPVDETLDLLISERASYSKLRQHVLAEGMDLLDAELLLRT